MAGKNYGTMSFGYYYDMAKKIGYDINVKGLYFSNVAYHSKGQLINQLLNSGYTMDNIEVKRVMV